MNYLMIDNKQKKNFSCFNLQLMRTFLCVLNLTFPNGLVSRSATCLSL